MVRWIIECLAGVLGRSEDTTQAGGEKFRRRRKSNPMSTLAQLALTWGTRR